MRRALALLLLLAFVGAATAQPAPYDLTTSDDVDVPDRTVAIEGTDYEIDAVSEVQPGETLTVDVAVGSGEDYYLDLYNADEKVEEWERGTGDGTQTFETDGIEPGTYALALEVDAKTRVVQPVVVSAYDLSLSVPGDATAGETVTATVTVDSALADGERVAVGVHGEGVERDVAASEAGDRSYEATFELEEPGEYAVYAAVRGQGEAAGYPVSTAISDGQTLSVGSDSDLGGGDGDGSGGEDGSDGGEDGDGSDGSDDNDESDGTEDGDGSDSSGDSDESDGSDGSEDGDGSTEDGGDTGGTDGDGTDDGAAPANGDSSADGDASDDGPMELNRSDGGDDANSADDQPVAPLVPVLGLAIGLTVAARRAAGSG